MLHSPFEPTILCTTSCSNYRLKIFLCRCGSMCLGWCKFLWVKEYSEQWVLEFFLWFSISIKSLFEILIIVQSFLTIIPMSNSKRSWCFNLPTWTNITFRNFLKQPFIVRKDQRCHNPDGLSLLSASTVVQFWY